MDMLSEVFPLLGGIFVALVCMTMRSPKHRWSAWAALSILFGVLATIVSGEYAVSFGFVLFDVSLVAGVAVSILVCRQVAVKIRSVG